MLAYVLSSSSLDTILSLAHRFICVELHGEESSVAFSRSIEMELHVHVDSEGSVVSCQLALNVKNVDFEEL